MKGIYTIEIENTETKEKKIIKKENAIREMYKRFYEIESFPGRFTTTYFHSYGIDPTRALIIPKEEDTPLTNTENEIILKSSMWDMTTSGYWTVEPSIYSNCQKHIGLSLDSRELETTKKHIYFSTGYLSGPFTVPGIMVYWICRYATKSSNPDYYAESRLFSAADIDPTIQVESNERIKFYYELIQEWE